jgi:hypothetical protein
MRCPPNPSPRKSGLGRDAAPAAPREQPAQASPNSNSAPHRDLTVAATTPTPSGTRWEGRSAPRPSAPRSRQVRIHPGLLGQSPPCSSTSRGRSRRSTVLQRSPRPRAAPKSHPKKLLRHPLAPGEVDHATDAAETRPGYGSWKPGRGAPYTGMTPQERRHEGQCYKARPVPDVRACVAIRARLLAQSTPEPPSVGYLLSITRSPS